MPQKQCPSCGESGYVFQAKCNYCYARKIAHLRSPDKRLSRKLQLAILDSMKQKQRDDVLRIVEIEFPVA